jgi:hypothetical protein
MNTAASRRAARRRGCRRNRKVNMSGGAGEAYTLGGPIGGPGQHIVNNYDGAIVRFPSCEGAVRPGYIADAQIKGGLPGFSGGARRRLRGGSEAFSGSMFAMGAEKLGLQLGGSESGFRGGVLETSSDQLGQLGGRRRKGTRRGRRGSRKQRGGRYAIGAEVTGPGGIAFATTDYTGCGAGAEGIHNALNKGDNFPAGFITAPPAQYNPATGAKLAGGRRCYRKTRKQSGGVGGVDSMFYQAPRSGYTHIPSNSAGGDAGTLADGRTPFLVNVPYSAQPTPSPACLKTGGSRRKTRKSRKSRKGRKGSRKH